MSSCIVNDGLPFDVIFLRRKVEANKGGDGAGGGGSRGGLDRLGANEELYVAEGKGCGDGVGAAGSVFTRSE